MLTKRDLKLKSVPDGALGHGLVVAAGIALAGKIDRKDYRVYTLLGDGELAEVAKWDHGVPSDDEFSREEIFHHYCLDGPGLAVAGRKLLAKR